MRDRTLHPVRKHAEQHALLCRTNARRTKSVRVRAVNRVCSTMLAMPKERSLVPSRRPLHSSSARPRSAGSVRARSHGQTPLSHATARRRSVKEQRVGGKAPVSLGSGLGLGAFGGDTANGARPPEGGTLLTRRRFLYGAAAVGAAGILAAGGAAIANVVGDGEGNSEDVPTLTVPENAVTTLSADSENFSQTADDAPLVQSAGTYDLPFGTLLWSSNDVNAACLIPTSGANPLTTVGIMNLSTGGVTTVLEQARDQAAGFDIYDVRCSQTGMVWTEANILQGVWRVWAAPLSADGALGSPIQLDEGDSAWETPSIAAAGDAAFWQCLPKANGVAATANSCVKRAAFGSSEVGTVYESEGRMATPLYALADAVVCTPRAATSGTYYQLTCLDAASGTVTDQVTLPASMRPLEAGYGPTVFSFCFEAAYNYGDGIAGVGTYTPLSEGASFDYEGRSWFCFSRTPTTAPAWCGDYFVVKSTSSVAVVDLASNLYTSLLAEDDADDWGEQLATTGTGSTLVTYQHIDAGSSGGTSVDEGESTADGESSSVPAASASYCCRVRVWHAAAAGSAAAAPQNAETSADDTSTSADDASGDAEEVLDETAGDETAEEASTSEEHHTRTN